MEFWNTKIASDLTTDQAESSICLFWLGFVCFGFGFLF